MPRRSRSRMAASVLHAGPMVQMILARRPFFARTSFKVVSRLRIGVRISAPPMRSRDQLAYGDVAVFSNGSRESRGATEDIRDKCAVPTGLARFFNFPRAYALG